MGQQDALRLGNLDAQRDWGHAPDYVRAMRMMLAYTEPGDYVVATGQLHSVREFCEVAFAHAGLDYRDWVRESAEDVRQDGRRRLVGDAAKAREVLGWQPETDFPTLVRLMVDASIAGLASRNSTT